MYKKFRKTAAVILTAALLLQSGVQGMAEEAQTGAAPTEAVTEAPETQAPTEVPQTEAPTEAPQTQAPTEAPQTQAPTEAPQTQAPTEAPQTQAPTEAPQTQAPTEAQQTGTSGETKQSESETEEARRSDRENDGEKMTADDLVSELGEALDYLFAADTVEAPEDLLEGQEILQGADSSSLLNSLGTLSIALANARSSKDVEVINLYADEDGKLDTAQLDKLYGDQVIDVTDKYYVVNVIADSADQTLDFSGYDMKLSGQTVNYKEETQPGDILYNFAAMDGEKYTAYKGSVALARGAGLQGAFLAPGADVHVNSSLAGSVFARNIQVADTVEKLLQIGFIDGIQAPETETPETKATEVPEETGAALETEGSKEQGTGEEQTSSAQENIGAADGLELNEPGDGETASASIRITVSAQNVNGDDAEINEWKNTAFVLRYEAESGNGGESSGEAAGETGGEAAGATTGKTEYVKDDAGVVRIFKYEGEPKEITGLSYGTYTLVQISSEEGYRPGKDQKITLSADEGTGAKEITVVNPASAGTYSIQVNVSAYYKGVELKAAANETRSGKYVALFREVNGEAEEAGEANEKFERISSVKELVYQADNSAASVEFGGLEEGAYILREVDAQGDLLPESPEPELKIPGDVIVVPEENGNEPVAVQATLNFKEYPNGKFYYLGTVNVTKVVKDKDGKDVTSTSSEVFYANLYTDNEKNTLADTVNSVVPAFTFKSDTDSAKNYVATCQVKLTQATASYYLAEVNADGNQVTSGDANFGYNITVPTEPLTIFCEEGKTTAAATITNQALSDQPQPDPTVVRIGVRDKASGKYISGVKLIIKDSNGKLVAGPYSSKSSIAKLSDADVQKLTPGETYYLSEVSAPAGYAPAKDAKFTIAEGQTQEIAMDHSEVSATNYQLTVSKQVYAGEHQVYANGTSSNHNFNVALFEDKDHIVKVSDVQKITMKGLTGSTVFKNLKHNATYYVAETDANGIPKSSSKTLTIQYDNSGEVKASSQNNTTTVKNVYTSLPSGYRYTAVLTLTKRLVNNSDSEAGSTFYAGIYRHSDYSDTPTIVKFDLSKKTSASVKRRILLPGKTEGNYTDVTYYIAEVDAKGNRLTASSDFDYDISIDAPEVTLGKSDSKTVTITNEKKGASKVTLYLTKRVYEGSAQKKVTETFYAGLFKDSSFTQPYTKPIPLSLKDKSEMTLKLSLNLGKASEATIYVAEVDANGKVITDQKGFGYEIKMVNSTAAFTKDQREVRSVLLNSVYGTSTQDDWQNIVDKNNWGDSDAVSDNGEASAGTAAAKTGDTTPVGWYLLLMAAAFAVFTGTACRRKRQ